MRFFRYVCLLLLAAVVMACGGGGGVNVPTSQVTVRTDWSSRLLPGGGQSQRISLSKLNGELVQSLVDSFDTNLNTELTFQAVQSGDYVLKSELFSQQNLAGIKTGEFAMQISINGPTIVNVVVGGTLTGIKVTPESASVKVPSSKQMYLQGLTQGGTTFIKMDQITWSVLGGIGSIGSDGIFVAEKVGTGSVRASHNQQSFQSSSAVTVTADSVTEKEWTVMVFLNAANDLYFFSDRDVNEMEMLPANDNVNLILQWKQSQAVYPGSSFDGTRRYKVKRETTNAIGSELVQVMSGIVDMGDPQTLADFIAWTKKNYPAKRYGLIVWNHGNGWRRKPNTGRAVSYDDQTNTALQIWDLKNALNGHSFDFIAWDASLMQMLEVAYEVKNFTKYVVGSEESPPGDGYPYTQALGPLFNNPMDSTANITKGFVDAMVNHPPYQTAKITQSVLDTSKLSALATATSNLANQLIANSAFLTELIPQVRQTAQGYSTTVSPPRYYRDLWDVAEKLKLGTDVTSVKQACQDVQNAIASALVWEGHNSLSPGSKGISIDFTPGNIFMNSVTDYSRLSFAADTLWEDWLVTAP
jgi:hypothetical protein